MKNRSNFTEKQLIASSPATIICISNSLQVADWQNFSDAIKFANNDQE